MKNRPFKQVDVFTPTPYYGNPLAVVLDAVGVDDAALQRFANWTNLSETTFLLPPTDPAADYRVRIFTPNYELPFAGHPTLGSCHAWLEAGGVSKNPGFVVQECQVGLVKIRREDSLPGTPPQLSFAAPQLKRSAPSPAHLAQVAAALGLKPQQILAAQLLDNGPEWLGLLLDSPQTVLQLSPDFAALNRLDAKVGVAGIYTKGDSAPALIGRANREARAFEAGGQAGAHAALPPEPDLEVRGFVVVGGANEDPVTGSLNAGLGQWLIADGHMPGRYLASQGVNLGRTGQVHIASDAAGQVWVGGTTFTCLDGSVLL